MMLEFMFNLSEPEIQMLLNSTVTTRNVKNNLEISIKAKL